MREAGVTDIQIPTLQITQASGFGDAAVWVLQHQPSLDFTSGGYFVQRGVDALVVGILADDEDTARVQAAALTQALLATP